MVFPSKNILVGGVIILGVLLIIITQTPHSPCINQIDIFKNSMVGVFYPKKVKNATRPARIKGSLLSCRAGNSEGACTDYFDDLRRFESEFSLVSKKCKDNQDEALEIYKLAEDAMETISNLAWLNPGSEDEGSQIGWLGPSQIALFCRLRQHYTDGLGIDASKELESRILSKFTANSRVCDECDSSEVAISKLDLSAVRLKSLLNVGCGQFL